MFMVWILVYGIYCDIFGYLIFGFWVVGRGVLRFWEG